MGDFNFPHIDWNIKTSHIADENKFLDIVNDNFLTQHVLTKTRGENILDLVLTNSKIKIQNLEVRESISNSDHSIIRLELELK